nr:hypothetical protein [Klebsiella pneumoniae]
PVGDFELLLCHGTVCVVGKMRDLILQLSKSSIYSTKPYQSEKHSGVPDLPTESRIFRYMTPSHHTIIIYSKTHSLKNTNEVKIDIHCISFNPS